MKSIHLKKIGKKNSWKNCCKSWNFVTKVSNPQCENCRNSLSHFFCKNVVKAMILQKKLLKIWFDELFYQWRKRISRFSTPWNQWICGTQCGNCRNSLSYFFHKKFVKVMVSLKKLLNTCSWFDEFFQFSEREFLVFNTSVRYFNENSVKSTF